MKICSLIPSGTEILFALGVGEQVAAVTQFCDYPAEAKTRHIVSRAKVDTSVLTAREAADIIQSLLESGEGTYVFDTDWIYREKPDLILTQDLCRVCDLESERVMKAIAALRPPPEVLVLSPKNLSDIFSNIKRLGEVTGTSDKAYALLNRIQSRIQQITEQAARAAHKPRVYILEWIEPLAACGHWMSEMVELAGGIDQLGNPGKPSPLITWEQVREYNPEIVIMIPCSCPIERTLRDVHCLARQDGWWDLQAVRDGLVYIVNSDYFVRPGPRVVQGLEIIAQLIHPTLFTGLIPPRSVVKLDLAAQGRPLPENVAQYFRLYP